MIPKIIHYCWFGRNPLPKLAQKCIRSWKKYCPDYEIFEWNEDNFDISAAPLYVRQAYETKKWAFVTDYVRLKVVYDHGGIYMDTDVELKKSLDSLRNHSAYFGFEDGRHVATGLGFGAVAGTDVLREIMDDYDGIPFVREDGSFDSETCPSRNTKVLLRHGLKQDDSMQVLDGDILILPSIYLCPLSFIDGSYKRSKETISIHHFSASWYNKNQHIERIARLRQFRRFRCKRAFHNAIHCFVHLPNILLRRILGAHNYEKFKKYMKKGLRL